MSEELEEQKWTNITVDSQILSTFMSCARKADFVFNQHLVPIQGVAPSIEKGLLTHVGTNAYWKTLLEGKDYQAATRAAIDAIKVDSLKYKNIDADNILDVLQTLIAFFKYINNHSWTPVFSEQYFKFIAYENKEERLRIILSGRIDLGLRNPQTPLLVVDNKSESERWFYSQMSNQFKIYALACKTNVVGVQRIGFQKTVEEKDKFELKLIPFDPDILDEFRYEILPYWCKELLKCKTNNYWPPNTTSCVHGHFKCIFSDGMDHKGICNVSRAVRQQKLDRYFTPGEPWNPENF